MKSTDIFNDDVAIVRNPVKAQEPDHEVQMAKSELYRAGKSAMALHNMLKSVSEQQGLEGWVQAKITKAADYLESVYHYLDYEMRGGELDEAGPVTGNTPSSTVAAPAPGAQATTTTPPPAQAAVAAASAAKAKKDIQAQIKQTQDAIRQAETNLTNQKKQLADLQKKLGQPMMEMGSAGASVAGGVATSIGGNGLKKKKKEIGSLFGGTYKQNEAAVVKNKKDEPMSEGMVDDKIDAIMAKYGEKRRGNIIHEIRLGEYIEMKAHGVKNVIAARNKALDVILQKGVRYYTDLNMKYHKRAEKAAKAKGETYHSWGDQSGFGRRKGYGVDQGVAEGEIRQRLDPKCWKGKHKEGTKIKGGVRVNNCVPNEGISDFDKPLSGWHIVSKAHGQVVRPAPKFKTKEEAQEYLMTKMFANHQDYKVVHVGNVKEGETGPKFTGYWKGKDKNPPGKKMVGSN